MNDALYKESKDGNFILLAYNETDKPIVLKKKNVMGKIAHFNHTITDLLTDTSYGSKLSTIASVLIQTLQLAAAAAASKCSIPRSPASTVRRDGLIEDPSSEGFIPRSSASTV
jgi:hypothetical protein